MDPKEQSPVKYSSKFEYSSFNKMCHPENGGHFVLLMWSNSATFLSRIDAWDARQWYAWGETGYLFNKTVFNLLFLIDWIRPFEQFWSWNMSDIYYDIEYFVSDKFSSLKLRRNRRQFRGHIFKSIFLNKNVLISTRTFRWVHGSLFQNAHLIILQHWFQ